MEFDLQSMAIDLPRVDGHPNRVPFRGALTMVDIPSDKPPSGARGHRVLLTRAAVDEALPSLLGMGLDYSPSLDRHDARRKVGVITGAEVLSLATSGRRAVGRRASLQVEGYLFARDFPDIVKEIKLQSGKAGAGERDRELGPVASPRAVAINLPSDHDTPALNARLLRARGVSSKTNINLAGESIRRLGMSYEIAEARVADLRADVWVVTQFTFTGAAVLWADKAAYGSTWIELARN
ncbi:MAG TPA: hypothetical protein VEG30_01145 [Terriglobales bacterium]|nr:hypothetical protein [Terriglobales bacterium]